MSIQDQLKEKNEKIQAAIHNWKNNFKKIYFIPTPIKSNQTLIHQELQAIHEMKEDLIDESTSSEEIIDFDIKTINDMRKDLTSDQKMILSELEIINQLRHSLEMNIEKKKLKQVKNMNTAQIYNELESINSLKLDLNNELEKVHVMALDDEQIFTPLEKFKIKKINYQLFEENTFLAMTLSSGEFKQFRCKIFNLKNPLSIIVLFFNPMESNLFDMIPMNNNIINNAYLLHEEKNQARVLTSIIFKLKKPMKILVQQSENKIIFHFITKASQKTKQKQKTIFTHVKTRDEIKNRRRLKKIKKK